jgi:hypothetical protein
MWNVVVGLYGDLPIELRDRLGLTSCWRVRNNSWSWVGRAGGKAGKESDECEQRMVSNTWNESSGLVFRDRLQCQTRRVVVPGVADG